MKLQIQVTFVAVLAIALAVGTHAAAQQGGSAGGRSGGNPSGNCPGWTGTSDINGTTVGPITVCGDILVQGKIDGGSKVTLTSTAGKITIDGKIDGGSTAILQAAGDITIGVVGEEGDKKIDGGSLVSAYSGGTISLGNKIDGCGNFTGGSRCTAVFFRAANGIDVANKIDGGVRVALCTANGSIHIHDKIDNGRTVVYYWQPSGSIMVDGGQRGGSQVSGNNDPLGQQYACIGLGIFGYRGYPQYSIPHSVP